MLRPMGVPVEVLDWEMGWLAGLRSGIVLRIRDRFHPLAEDKFRKPSECGCRQAIPNVINEPGRQLQVLDLWKVNRKYGR